VASETSVTCFHRLVVPDNLWKVEKWNKKRVGTTDGRIILFLVSASQSMTALNRPSHARRIVQSTGIVMAAILLSRLLGFLREWTVAHQIGSGKVTDAYYAAFTLPDVLNYMVASGSLGIIFIPIFARYLAKNQEDEGWYVFSTVMTFMSLLLVGLVLLGEIFAPQLIRIIAPGFDPTEKARVVFLTRLMLPAQIFFYLGSVMASVQYAKGQFVMPSLAAVVYNLGIILGLAAFLANGNHGLCCRCPRGNVLRLFSASISCHGTERGPFHPKLEAWSSRLPIVSQTRTAHHARPVPGVHG
jgi:hypothetical protein